MFIAEESCLTLCDPTDGSPPGCSAHGDSPGKKTGVGCHFGGGGGFMLEVLGLELYCDAVLRRLCDGAEDLVTLKKRTFLGVDGCVLTTSLGSEGSV